MASPVLSVVLPVYNEADTLDSALRRLGGAFDALGCAYEVVLVENGSRDASAALCDELARRDPRLRCVHLPDADRSAALRRGLAEAAGRYAILTDVDHHDLSYFRRALDLLEDGRGRLAVGTKNGAGGRDRRPPHRRLASGLFNFALRRILGWDFSDVHGPKAFVRADVALADLDRTMPVDVALLAYAKKAGLTAAEVPVVVAELRPPRRGGTFQVLFMLRTLSGALRYALRARP